MSGKILLFVYFLFAFAVSVNCQISNSAVGKQKSANDKPCKFLSISDAEKILGQASRFIEATAETNGNSQIMKCTYTTLSKDKTTGRDINLFFILEESSTNEEAKQVYEAIWKSNKNHNGVEILSGIGDEAYSHSDKPNFHFVMARKGKFTIRLKINKAVETTSLDELKAFSKKAIERL